MYWVIEQDPSFHADLVHSAGKSGCSWSGLTSRPGRRIYARRSGEPALWIIYLTQEGPLSLFFERLNSCLINRSGISRSFSRSYWECEELKILPSLEEDKPSFEQEEEITAWVWNPRKGTAKSKVEIQPSILPCCLRHGHKSVEKIFQQYNTISYLSLYMIHTD